MNGRAPADAARSDAERAVDDLVRTSGARWVLGDRLPGGRQSGAWAVVGPDGRTAVLKTADPAWATQVRRVARTVDGIRAAGYPTPAWLAVGTTPDGIGYQVQERVAGAPIEILRVDAAAAFVRLVDRQAGLDPDPARCWNDFLAGELDSGWTALRAAAGACGPPGRALVAICGRFARSARPERWPRTDLVHGDLRPANVLFDGDRIAGVVDVEALGSGTRAFDLATLLSHDAIEPPAVDVLAAAGSAVAGREVLRACVAQVFLDLVRFTAARGDRTAVLAVVHRLLDRAERIERDVRCRRAGTGAETRTRLRRRR